MSRLDCRAKCVPVAGLALPDFSSGPKRRLNATWRSSSRLWSWNTSTEYSSSAARISPKIASSIGAPVSTPPISAQKSGCNFLMVMVMRRLLKLVQAVRPAPAQMMGNRQRLRQRNPVRIVLAGSGARDHLADFLALEPARLGKFLGVDRDFLADPLREKPHHQGRRERPGLRRQVLDPADADAALLLDLAPHRLLRRLARLHKPGEAREA